MGVLVAALSLLDVKTLLVFLAVLLLAWLILKKWKDRARNLPPGPKGLFQFIVWNIANYRDTPDHFEALNLMRKHFKSDIFASCAGWQVGVILNSFDLIKQAFSKRADLVDRPSSFIVRELGQNKGLVGSNGYTWKDQRRFLLSKLKDFDTGKNLIQQSIHEEAHHLTSRLALNKDQDVDLRPFFSVAVSNILLLIALSERHQYGDEELINLVHAMEVAMLKSNMASLATDVIPFLQYLPGDLFAIRYIRDAVKNLRDYALRKINKRKANVDPNDIQCLTDAFLVKAERQRDDPDNIYTDEQLVGVIFDLLLAGTDTTVVSLHWTFLYLVLHPDVQRKVQREIDDVIGQERPPEVADRTKMPYTEAVIMEAMRCGTVVPFGIPHGNISADVKIEGYDVPKHVSVTANIWAVHHDKDYWPYPDEFNPENFLDEDGNLVPREHFMPFLIGRRACPGEALVRMEIFVYFVSMLQKFTFEIPAGSPPPSKKGNLGVAHHPDNFKVHVIERVVY